MSELEADAPYNTRTHQGLPPTPIGNPGLASIRAAANPAKTELPLLRRQAGGNGEHAFSEDRRRVPAGRPALRRRRARPRAASRPSTVDPPRSASSAGRSRTAARRRCTRRPTPPPAWRAGATSCCRCRPSCSPRRCARCPAPGFVGANVTIPHKEAALARPTTADRRGPGDRRGEHADASTDGAIEADNTDAPGLPGRAAASRRRPRAVVLGAGGSARAVVWALREAGAPRSRSGTARPSGRSALAAELGARAVDDVRARRAARQLHRGRPGRGDDPFDELPLEPAGWGSGRCVVDLVYGDGETALSRAAREARRARRWTAWRSSCARAR